MKILRRIELVGLIVFVIAMVVVLIEPHNSLYSLYPVRITAFSVMSMSAVTVGVIRCIFSYYSIRYQIWRKGQLYIMVPVAWFFLVGSVVGIVDVLFLSRVFSLGRCSAAGVVMLLLYYGSGIGFDRKKTRPTVDGR